MRSPGLGVLRPRAHMDTFAKWRGGDLGKFGAIIRAFPDLWHGAVLDVGCRTGNFRTALAAAGYGGCRYVGLDLRPPADVVADLDHGLPFDDEAFEVVLCLDVLEHTDNIHRNLGEVCRVAANAVVVALPNVQELGARLRFLAGRELSGKYGLPVEPPGDRHRWVLSYEEARAFCQYWAPRHGFEVAAQGAIAGSPCRRWTNRWLASRMPNLFAPTYVGLLRRVR